MGDDKTWKVGWGIYRKEGVRGLWRGVGPTSQRSGLLAGVQLPAYDIAKERIKSLGVDEGPQLHLIASLMAGLAAALASNPVDVVRTRMMVQRRLQGGKEEGVRLYKSTIHCAYHTVRGEGPAALYKGFLPSFARMGPWNVIFFLVYERLKLWNFGGSSKSTQRRLTNSKGTPPSLQSVYRCSSYERLPSLQEFFHINGESSMSKFL